MLEDNLLIWKLKRGRLDALWQIYDKYKADPLKLAESHNRIRIEHNLKNYLVTCTLNRARTALRDAGAARSREA